MKLLIITLIVIFILIYIITNVTFKKMLFYPSDDGIDFTPDMLYKSYYLYINRKYDLEKCNPKHSRYINVWLFNNHFDKEYILYFHGSAGNIKDCKKMINICKEFKLNLLLVDYRGYGKSSPDLDHKHILEDGQIAYDFLLNFTTPDKIIVWGESLGGAIGTHVAKNNKVKALILLSTFSCLDDIAKYGDYSCGLTKLSSIITSMITNFPICKWISEVDAPIVIGHSDQDTLINIQCAYKNYDCITHNQKKIIIYKGDHTTPIITSDMIKDILDFCYIYYYDNQLDRIVKVI